MKSGFKALGKKVTKFTKLETFPTPKNVLRVTCTSDEVTALCPITGAPDWYIVRISYIPDKRCVESKTLKLFLQDFRQQGHFCEKFASIIAQRIWDDLEPFKVEVTVTQKPRGGVAIEAIATLT